MAAATLRALESIERRLDDIRTTMRHEWTQAATQRDHLAREIDALAAELALLQVDVAQLRRELENPYDTRRTPEAARQRPDQNDR